MGIRSQYIFPYPHKCLFPGPLMHFYSYAYVQNYVQVLCSTVLGRASAVIAQPIGPFLVIPEQCRGAGIFNCIFNSWGGPTHTGLPIQTTGDGGWVSLLRNPPSKGKHFQAWKPCPPTPPKVPLEAPSNISPPGSCTYQVRGLSGLLPSWSKDRGSIYWLPVRDSIYGLFLLRRGTSVLCVGYQDISRPHALAAERDFLLISLCGGYPCSHSSMGWGGGTPVNRRTTPAHFPIVHSHLALSLVFTPALASGQEGTLVKILAGDPRSNNFTSFPNVPPPRNPDSPVFPCPWTKPENWSEIISPKSYMFVVNHVSSNLPNFFRGELPHFQKYLSSGHKHLRTFFGASTFFGIWQTSNFSFWSRFKLRISNSTEIWHMHPNKIKALFSSPCGAKICFFVSFYRLAVGVTPPVPTRN